MTCLTRRLATHSRPLLQFEEVLSPGSPSPSAVQRPRTAFVLHGLLGNARNWRSFAKLLAERLASGEAWRLLLIDQRHHGASAVLRLPGPDTLASAADDLTTLALHTGFPEVVLGHSLGGKLALEWTSSLPSSAANARPCAILLDSSPGAVTGDPHHTGHVLETVRSLPAVFASRSELQELLAGRLSPALASWLASSLVPVHVGGSPLGPLRFSFHLPGAEALYEDYKRQDLFDVLRSTDNAHLVMAGKSGGWEGKDVAEQLARMPRERLHVLPEAGHWLHASHPRELAELIAPLFRA